VRISDELASRAGTRPPTAADLQMVLAALGPAESIAPAPFSAASSASSASTTSSARRRPRVNATISTLALVGAVWASVFFAMVILLTIKINVQPGPGQAMPWWQTLLNFVLQPLGWAAPIATTVLGLMAIGAIQKSDGAKYGLSLALFDALLFPLLLLDWLVLVLGRQLAIALIQQDVMAPGLADAIVGQMLPVVAIILGDYYLVRRAWGAVRPDEE
jgi:hypothetical protein